MTKACGTAQRGWPEWGRPDVPTVCYQGPESQPVLRQELRPLPSSGQLSPPQTTSWTHPDFRSPPVTRRARVGPRPSQGGVAVLVPGERGQWAPRGSGELNHLLPGGQPLIVYVKPGSWEDPAPPFLCLLSLPRSSPWASPLASGLLSGAKTDFPVPASPLVRVRRELVCLSCNLAALPSSGRAACHRRKPGCEELSCFPGVAGVRKVS